jgi:uncharacterized membrane protein YfcA
VPIDLIWILPFIGLGAFLYSSVGHGGATVYLAILTLADFAVGGLVTTILVLNILAAAIAFITFQQAGHLRVRLLLPFVVTSVPLAYLGGLLHFSGRAQAILLATALLLGSVRFLAFRAPPRIRFVPVEHWAFYVIAPLLGCMLGFLAGATGIGGGIFLSPILFALGWASLKEAASLASAFIVLNSGAGLAAKLPHTPLDAAVLLPMLVVVLVGAVVGSFFGARRLPPRALQVLLGVVLLVAGVKTVL